MQTTSTTLLRWPGNENEGGTTANSNEEKIVYGQQAAATSKPKPKGFFAKLKAALQDWSNGDQQQQEEDDQTP